MQLAHQQADSIRIWPPVFLWGSRRGDSSLKVQHRLPLPKLNFLLLDRNSLGLPLKGSHDIQLLLPATRQKWLHAPGVGEHRPFLWPAKDRTQSLRPAGWRWEVRRESLPLLSTSTLCPSFSRSRRPGPALWAAATTTTWTRSALSWCRVQRTKYSCSVSCTGMVFTLFPAVERLESPRSGRKPCPPHLRTQPYLRQELPRVLLHDPLVKTSGMVCPTPKTRCSYQSPPKSSPS